jgi:putative nucleotidyltransferase with HDIG domain
MRLVSVRRCRPGAILARSVYLDNGTVLVGEGVELTQRMIDRLIAMHVTNVYIRDSRTSDVEVQDAISEQTRREAMGVIFESFRKIQDDPKKWRYRFLDQQMGRQFRQVMHTVIDELKQNRAAMNLLGNACATDHYIFSHSLNVALYSTALALKAGYKEKELLEIGLGAMLHDIGKMAIPLDILKKPGTLTEEEYAIIQTHTEVGFEMLRQQDEIPLLSAHCAFQHHERMDGSGYPRGLKGDQIHPYARLLAVCDVFDALTTPRVYRQPMLPHEAMEILYGGADKLFASSEVENLRDTIAMYPIGLSVRLSTGDSGVVVDYNRGLPGRPIVRILQNEAGEELAAPYEIDLSKHLDIVITACDSLP